VSEFSGSLRVPPQNIEAEQAVLGSMMLSKEAVSVVLQLLEPEFFYKSAHQKIFKAILTLEQGSEPVDQLTVSDILKRMGELEAVGGAYYITGLAESIPSTANVEYYARLVMEAATLRDIIVLAGTISTEAYEAKDHVDDVLDDFERRIFDISKRRFKKQGFEPIKPALEAAFEMVEKSHQSPGAVRGTPSGFSRLDELTSGFQSSDLIILAARPSMGKTAFALTVARNAAVMHGIPVGIFSLEMASYQLAMRLLCSEARVDMHLVRTGKLPSNLWGRLSKAAGKLANAPIFLDDTASLTVLEIRAKARRLKAERDIKLLIVDYLQLITGPRGIENRQQEISLISRSLKTLAKELDIPIIALSQLSRAVESRTDKRPMLSDLRESGSLEQDADVVTFIYRPEKYNLMDDSGNSQEGIAEIIIGKQRNGPTGSVKLAFIDKYAAFEEMPGYIPPEASGKPLPL